MRAIGYFRAPAARDEPGEQAGRETEGEAASFERDFEAYCDLYLHQPLRIFAEPPGGTERFGEMLGFMRGSGSEFLAVVPDATHLGADLEAVARSLMAIEGTGSAVTCMDGEFPDPVQNAFQTLGVRGVSKTRSLRARESMRNRAAEGRALGRPPFGYRIGEDGTLDVVPDQAAVVELIYRLYVSEELGFRLIVQHLNERGITTRAGRAWNVVTVRDILRNPVYTGTYSRFGMRLPRSHEPIIAPDVHRGAQDIMRRRRPVGRVSRAEPFLLSGLVTCARCGNRMMGVTRRQKWRRKDGRRGSAAYRYYQCQSRQNQGRCEYGTWRAHMLERSVLGHLRERLARSVAEDRLDPAEREARALRAAERRAERVRAAERRLVRALRRVARAEIPLYLIADYLAVLDAARGAADGGGEGPEAALARLSADPPPEFAELRALLEDNVVRIVVGDGDVEVSV